jgi:hypothetical protein
VPPKRIRGERLELLLAETLAAALRAGVATPQDFERVNIDATVQPKAVTHPTDSKLLHGGVEKAFSSRTTSCTLDIPTRPRWRRHTERRLFRPRHHSRGKQVFEPAAPRVSCNPLKMLCFCHLY